MAIGSRFTRRAPATLADLAQQAEANGQDPQEAVAEVIEQTLSEAENKSSATPALSGITGLNFKGGTKGKRKKKKLYLKIK